MSTFTLQDLNLPMTAEDALKAIEQHTPTNEDNMNNNALPHAPEPQPTLTDIINTICTQLQLLSTVISQPKAQPEEGTNVPNLQDCVEQVLVQAGWFEELVKRQVEALDITNIAKDAVQEVVESEVESYFENNFDPTYHFDFDDAVHDAVEDRIDNVVSDKIDDAVDAYLSNATISISK